MGRVSKIKAVWLGMLMLLSVVFLMQPITAHAELARPVIKTVVTGDRRVKLTWKKVAGATGYVVYSVTEDGELKKVASTSKKTAVTKTLKKLKNGKTYTFCVTARKKSEESEPSPTVTATPTMPGLQKMTYCFVSSNGHKKVQLRWGANKNATGYIIYQENSEGEYEPIAKTSGTSYTVKNLKNDEEYHFKVSAYRKKGTKIYAGALSDVLIGRPVASYLTDYYHSYYYKATMKAAVTVKGVTIPKGATVLVLEKGKTKSLVEYRDEEVKVSNSKFTINSITVDPNARKRAYYSKSDAEEFVNIKGYTSTSNYMIWISTYGQYLYVFEGSQYNWKLKFMTICATGKLKYDMDVKEHKKGDPCETPIGISRIWGKRPVWEFQADQCAYWASSCSGGAIHSWLYYPNGGGKWNCVGAYGTPSSHGCIRVEIDYAKWIYDNCPMGTTVVVL